MGWDARMQHWRKPHELSTVEVYALGTLLSIHVFPSFPRLLWLCGVLAAVVIFVYIMTKRVQKFNKHDTVADVQVKYNPGVPFPAVTICNQNLFR